MQWAKTDDLIVRSSNQIGWGKSQNFPHLSEHLQTAVMSSNSETKKDLFGSVVFTAWLLRFLLVPHLLLPLLHHLHILLLLHFLLLLNFHLHFFFFFFFFFVFFIFFFIFFCLFFFVFWWITNKTLKAHTTTYCIGACRRCTCGAIWLRRGRFIYELKFHYQPIISG